MELGRWRHWKAFFFAFSIGAVFISPKSTVKKKKVISMKNISIKYVKFKDRGYIRDHSNEIWFHEDNYILKVIRLYIKSLMSSWNMTCTWGNTRLIHFPSESAGTKGIKWLELVYHMLIYGIEVYFRFFHYNRPKIAGVMFQRVNYLDPCWTRLR